MSQSPDRSQYFYRNVVVSKSADKVYLVDIHNPAEKSEALEPWLGIVIQFADGQHTVTDLINYLSNHYKGPPPANLDQTVLSAVARLQTMQLIVLTKEKVTLPYYLSLPIEQLDLEKARRLMTEDAEKYSAQTTG